MITGDHHRRLLEATFELEDIEDRLFKSGQARSSGRFHRKCWIRRTKGGLLGQFGAARKLIRELRTLGLEGVPGSSIVSTLSGIRNDSIRLHADAVLFKSNPRAFYLEPGLTLKFALSGFADRCEGIRRELRWRGEIQKAGRIMLPAISLASDGERPFMLEQLVPEARALKSAELGNEIAQELWTFYEANRIEARRLSEIFDIDAAIRVMNEVARSIGEKTDAASAFLRMLEAVPDIGEAQVPIGMCHGDLTCSNMLLSGDSLYLVDWEHAHRGFLFTDFIKPCLLSAAFQDGIAHFYDEWCAARRASAISVPVLLGIASVLDVKDYWRGRRTEPSTSSDWRSSILRNKFERINLTLRKPGIGVKSS